MIQMAGFTCISKIFIDLEEGEWGFMSKKWMQNLAENPMVAQSTLTTNNESKVEF